MRTNPNKHLEEGKVNPEVVWSRLPRGDQRQLIDANVHVEHGDIRDPRRHALNHVVAPDGLCLRDFIRVTRRSHVDLVDENEEANVVFDEELNGPSGAPALLVCSLWKEFEGLVLPPTRTVEYANEPPQVI